MTRGRAAELQATVQTPGWVEVMVPDLQAQQRAAIDLLAMTLEERPTPKASGNFVRGYLRGITYALTRWERLIKEAEQAEQQPSDEVATGSPYEARDD